MRLNNTALKLLDRLYEAAKRYDFKFGLSRSALKISELNDFHTLYQQGYIFSKPVRGTLLFIPTDKGKKLVLERGQTQLFPVEGYYLFFLDPDYQHPYKFEKNGKIVQAKTSTLEAALAFKKRATAKNIDVFFRMGFPVAARRLNPAEFFSH